MKTKTGDFGDDELQRLVDLTGKTRDHCELALKIANGDFEFAARLANSRTKEQLMSISASDVKKLRDETDAPMMECKAALEEAGGDFERAKQILREKGKAAAAKRSDRSTSEGVVAISIADTGKTAGAVVVECETDFVARNEDFIAFAQELAVIVCCDPNADQSILDAKCADAVAKIRENIKVTKFVRKTTNGGFGSYVHHDRKKGAIIEYAGDTQSAEAISKSLAIQVVAFPNVQAVKKEDLSQELLNQELETEFQRAVKEGKPEEIARNIAKGRVNKEFVKSSVLLEQDYYADLTKTVGTYVSEESKSGGGSMDILGFTYLAVGASN